MVYKSLVMDLSENTRHTSASRQTPLQRELHRRMRLLGLSARGLSLSAGLNDSAVKNILNGRSVHPRADTLTALARALGCTMSDLLCTPTDSMGDNTPPTTTRGSSSDVAFLPIYDLRLSAGPGAWVEDHPIAITKEPFRRALLEGLTASPVSLLLMARVSGDSMDPSLVDGDTVLVDRGQAHPTRDGIYALRWVDDVMVKRISVDPRDGFLSILSDNRAYRSYESVAPQDITILGRVIWLARSL